MKCHGINVRSIKGYSSMNDEDKKAYEKFIIKMLNGCGLMYRNSILPLAVYRAYEIEYLVQVPGNDYYIVIGGEVLNKDTNIITDSWEDKENIYLSSKFKVEKEKSKEYLRFEYLYKNEFEWLHIINNGEEWY